MNGVNFTEKSVFEKYGILGKDYITPEMFGAVGDGVTDDTNALKACLDKGSVEKTLVVLSKYYYVTRNVYCQSYLRVTGIEHSRQLATIVAGPNVTTLFILQGVRCNFSNLQIKTYDGNYHSGVVAFDCYGGANKDCDTDLRNVSINYFEIGCIIRGRNFRFLSSSCSHCKIGLKYEFEEGVSALRGLNIQDCSFHGIGEESDIPWFTNSYAIDIHYGGGSNMMIQGCKCDNGSTFFHGFAQNVLMENNFVECWKNPAVEFYQEEPHALPTYGTFTCRGNVFQGRYGQVTDNYVETFPENLVVLKNFTRGSFSNNTLKLCRDAAVKIESCQHIQCLGNCIQNTGLVGTSGQIYTVDPEKEIAFYISNSNYISISNNMNLTNSTSMELIKFDDSNPSSNIHVSTNYLFNWTPDRNAEGRFSLIDWSIIGSVTSTQKSTFKCPRIFMVKTSYSGINFFGSYTNVYYASDSVFDASNKYMYDLTFTHDTDTGYFTPRLRRWNLSDLNSGPSTLNAELRFYTLYNV